MLKNTTKIFYKKKVKIARKSSFYCYAQSEESATFHLFAPDNPFDRLATGKSSSHVIENVKTDDYLHKFSARLKERFLND